MFCDLTKEFSLVSVIITCYNQGEYLARAIESVLLQSYKQVEIIVVDDGSTDNTKSVSDKYPDVKYIYQANQGLAAARNTGIDNSQGDYLVFLDADDWLLNDALLINLKHLKRNKAAALVSGEHIKVNKNEKILYISKKIVKDNHYCHLLQGDYFQMHATVMYRRWVYEIFRFDSSFNPCEDYNLILRVCRKFPILHHNKLIAVYYKHEQNMSGNIPLMLETNLFVLQEQKRFLKNPEEEKCLKKGIKYFKDHYCPILYFNVLYKSDGFKKGEIYALRKYNKFLYFRYLVLKKLRIVSIKSYIKKKVPYFILCLLQKNKH